MKNVCPGNVYENSSTGEEIIVEWMDELFVAYTHTQTASDGSITVIGPDALVAHDELMRVLDDPMKAFKLSNVFNWGAPDDDRNVYF